MSSLIQHIAHIDTIQVSAMLRVVHNIKTGTMIKVEVAPIQPADPSVQVDPSSDMDRRLLYSLPALLSISVTNGQTTGQSLKMTGETLEVRSDKRKPRKERENVPKMSPKYH